MNKVAQQTPYHHVFVWVTALLCTIIPFCGNAYGYVANVESDQGFAKFECWIQGQISTTCQLCLYAPAIIFILFAILLLFYAPWAWHKGIINKPWRSCLYSIAFVVIWAFPAILRVRAMIFTSDPAPILVWLHHLGLSTVGLFNALIWDISSRMPEKGKCEKMECSSNENAEIQFANKVTIPISSQSLISKEQNKWLEHGRLVLGEFLARDSDKTLELSKRDTQDIMGSKMEEYLSTRRGFQLFVSHCVKHYSLEKILFVTEVNMWKLYLQQTHIEESEWTAAGLQNPMALPEDLPTSTLINKYPDNILDQGEELFVRYCKSSHPFNLRTSLTQFWADVRQRNEFFDREGRPTTLAVELYLLFDDALEDTIQLLRSTWQEFQDVAQSITR